MFWYLKGSIVHLEESTVTLQVEWTGLGYDIIVSPSLLSRWVLTNQVLELWIHHHRTDVSETLFGFENPGERTIFRSLIKVNGVGGKTGIALLWLGEESLIKAIQFEDDALLSSVPWIGKKTAQKIIVELKGSIDFTKKSSNTGAKNSSDTTLISSLVGMGYDKRKVEEVVQDIPPSLSLQERTIQAIRELAK
jgi:Holliday junction DNA helicase RuvA